MNIGEKVREVVVRPVELPIPQRTTVEEPEHVVEPRKREVEVPTES